MLSETTIEEQNQVSTSVEEGSFWLKIIRPEYMSPIGRINLIFGVLVIGLSIACLILGPINEGKMVTSMFFGIIAFFLISLIMVGNYDSKVLIFKKNRLRGRYGPIPASEKFPRRNVWEPLAYAAFFAILVEACYTYYETRENLYFLILLVGVIISLILLSLIFRWIEKNKS